MDEQTSIGVESGYRTLFEHVPDGMLLVAPDSGQIRDVNERFTSMCGFAHETLVGERLADLIAGDRPEESVQTLVDAGDEGVEWRLQRREGDPFVAALSASVGSVGGQRCVVTTVRNVSGRKGREDEERSSDSGEEVGWFEELVEHVPTGIFRARLDPNEPFLEANPTMVDLFDATTRTDLLSTPVGAIYADGDDCTAFFERLEEERVVSEKIELRTLDGETFWGQVTACRFTDSDGETYVDGAIKDVTETREHRRVLEEQNERLQLLNRIVRHDIRNDMQIIQGMADLLGDVADSSDSPHLETIQSRTEHVIELTDLMGELMDALVAESGNELEPTNLSFVLDREVRGAQSSHPESTIRTRGNVPLVEVQANDMLRSVFRNLLTNAVRHHDGEEPTVEVSAEIEDDGWVLVQVADDGPGIDPERRDVVFGKGEKGIDSEGTGLGLYLVYALVDHYGGSVWIEDNDPRGSVFNVRLRLA